MGNSDRRRSASSSLRGAARRRCKTCPKTLRTASMLRAFGLNGKHSLAEVCCQGDDDDVAGDDNDDVDDVGQIDFIALSTGCMSMMMKVTATFDGRTRLHIEHLQERKQDAQFSKLQLCKFRCRAAPTPTEHAVGTSNRLHLHGMVCGCMDSAIPFITFISI